MMRIDKMADYLRSHPGLSIYLSILLGLITFTLHVVVFIAIDHAVFGTVTPHSGPGGYEILYGAVTALASILNSIALGITVADKLDIV